MQTSRGSRYGTTEIENSIPEIDITFIGRETETLKWENYNKTNKLIN